MKSLSYLNKYFLKYKWRFLLGVLFIIATNIFTAQMPIIIGDGVDELSHLFDDSKELDKEKLIKSAAWVGGLYFLFAFIKGFFLFLTRQTIIIMSRLIEYDLKNEVYAQYQRLSAAFYKKNNTGDLMNRISEDVSKVRMYLGPAVMYTINLVFLFVFVIWQMLSVSWELTLYVFSPLPIMSVLIYFVSRMINKRSEQVQIQQSSLSTMAQEAFSGIRVLKAYHREDLFSAEFDRASESYKEKTLRQVKVEALFMPTIIVLIGISTILAVYIGGLKAMDGEITVGQILSFVMYINLLTWPFASLGWVTSIVQRAEASQKRINEFLLEEPEISNPTTSPLDLRGEIEFRNVSFTYPESGIQALHDVSFNIKPGETLAIIGRTGSGKSTITNLVCRLFDPSSGKIFIDGKELNNINLDAYRKDIGYVPQEVFLFSDSIKENIAFGLDGNKDMDAIEGAAKKADLFTNIMSFQNGFDTILGERGITLSGGQKQRLSIARAIIKNPKILVFDDCLSAVDTETEENILRSLKDDMGAKTTLIISHRVSSVKNADKIIVLDNGAIIESGSHDELYNLDGSYRQLYDKQLLENQK